VCSIYQPCWYLRLYSFYGRRIALTMQHRNGVMIIQSGKTNYVEQICPNATFSTTNLRRKYITKFLTLHDTFTHSILNMFVYLTEHTIRDKPLGKSLNPFILLTVQTFQYMQVRYLPFPCHEKIFVSVFITTSIDIWHTLSGDVRL
jgi:hypothetical protein